MSRISPADIAIRATSSSPLPTGCHKPLSSRHDIVGWSSMPSTGTTMSNPLLAKSELLVVTNVPGWNGQCPHVVGSTLPAFLCEKTIPCKKFETFELRHLPRQETILPHPPLSCIVIWFQVVMVHPIHSRNAETLYWDTLYTWLTRLILWNRYNYFLLSLQWECIGFVKTIPFKFSTDLYVLEGHELDLTAFRN